MRTLSLYALAVTLALTAVSPAFAVTRRDDRTDAQYLNLGAQYSSVGQFSGTEIGPGYTSSFTASGVLIAPEWVLTAGHVADSSTSSLTFKISGGSYNASAWYAHPNWTGNLATGYDIALVKLAAPISAPTATLYNGTAELGKVGTYVGFGRTGTGTTGATTYDGKKRGAQNMLDMYYDGNYQIILSDFDQPNVNKKQSRRVNVVGSASPLDLEGLIAPGDSGGGLFITEGGRQYLAGINSWVTAYNTSRLSSYGDYTGAIRVSSFVGWINSVIDGNATSSANGTFYAGNNGSLLAMDNPIPEPASLTVLALGASALLLRRRRRPE